MFLNFSVSDIGSSSVPVRTDRERKSGDALSESAPAHYSASPLTSGSFPPEQQQRSLASHMHLALTLNETPNNSLLQSEDVESFFKNLDKPGQPPINHTSGYLPSTSGYAMFHQSVPSMSGMHGSPPSYYHDSTGSNTFLSHHPGPGGSPVYVPTTRGVLPGVQTMSNGNQGGHSQGWPNVQDPAYSTTPTHPSVSPRFAFPPTPSPPVQSPGGRTEGYGSPLGRGGLPYSHYMGADISSHWNTFSPQGAMLGQQQGLRRSNTLGEYQTLISIIN